jgi:NAD-dependent dihydropyrimidine dehydrogenase PreA subunit
MTHENDSSAAGLSAGYSYRPVPCSTRPIIYNQSLCIGCNRCASVCQCDILLPSPVKGEHPIVAYPGECYYCGACVMVCPRKGAIRLEHPLMNQAKYVPVIPESEVLN